MHTALTSTIESQQPLETPEDPTSQRPLRADVEISEEDVDEFLREVLGEDDASPRRITLADVAGLDDVKQRLERGFLGAARNSNAVRVLSRTCVHLRRTGVAIERRICRCPLGGRHRRSSATDVRCTGTQVPCRQ